MARSIEVWEKKFKVVLGCFGLMETLSKDGDLIECASTMFRNPIVFDNNKKEVKQPLPYQVGDFNILDKSNLTEDHLIGTSNMVLYMFKNELYKKWRNVEDFKKTLRALNVLLPVTKSLNNKNTFKSGWSFDLDNINDCLKWNDKLKSVGIKKLVCEKTGRVRLVDTVWKKWYKDNKEYLLPHSKKTEVAYRIMEFSSWVNPLTEQEQKTYQTIDKIK